VIVIDYAHNAAGMAGLTQTCRGLCRPGRDVWLAICTAGDRTDEILHDFAYTAARGADHLAIAELARYLRGRERLDIVERLSAGARDGGATELDVYADELSALRGMFARSRRGDALAVTALGMRTEIFEWLGSAGATRPAPARVRSLVRTARVSASAAPGTPIAGVSDGIQPRGR
jgi:cyanophycin synthetase